ncbi:trypsin-like peptidase domain-containing protein [Shimia marina]|uniref:Periplasmic pH-dependent serine endoprotease DegQ n=1 Tax=Shimia marina TaxID=321267 RepID=A0A0P1EKQ7_9RHOB|nr:trypsin-like peptidase domain-containing protein [Shimia marina]CUH50931.1 Periplasmic pH-dependent serine endoprotease DegQ precursor [Shimia marina]SFE57185.1 Do/DeqQ family serine protease [Shimia marina]
MIRSALIACVLAVATPLMAETKIPQSQAEISLGFAPLVKEAAPAVVNIFAKQIVQVRQSPFTGDPFFDQFFRGFGNSQPRVENSLGSGVILSEDGIVVSNYHVVGMSTDIRVQLNDRTEYTAEVLLSDEESDLAILKLKDAEGLPFLTLRDSDNVDVGELVMAIGNPFGVGQTVTSGIVSGLARSGVATGNARGYFIQTDAAINPGNSGGALIDVNGDLIGINTSILTRSGGSNGIGFAIPARLVAQFVEQARSGFESFQRPWAGMFGQPVDADMAEGLGLRRAGGIVVSALHDASPFLAAGMEPGDVIVALDGLPVNTPAEMIFRMSVAGLGSDVNVEMVRDGEVQTRVVKMAVAPDTPARETVETGRRSAIPGMVMSNINPAVLGEFGLPLNLEGVVVETPGDVGARLGLGAGDVLREIDGTPIVTTKDAEKALRDARKRLTLEVQRGTQRVVMRFRL